MHLMFSDYLRSMAAWRREKAREFPHDGRNERSAAALDALADFFDSDDADPSAVAQLRAYAAWCGGETTMLPGKTIARAVSRYGFDRPARSQAAHDAFLDELAVLASIDADTLDGRRRRQHLARLGRRCGWNPWEVEAILDGVELDCSYIRRRESLTEPEQREWIGAARARTAAEPEHCLSELRSHGAV
jgi:hypothetical protein